MNTEFISIDAITTPAGRRRLDLAWVETLSWLISEQGQKTPIELVRDGQTLTLVAGAHRLEAMRRFGSKTIAAIVRDRSDFESEAQIALAEITENLARRELSVLDRAVDIARWRDIYEATNNVTGRGRPKKRGKVDEETSEEISRTFATNFPEKAQQVLGVARDSIFRALRIARIGADVRHRISLLPLADNQSELLALAAESPDRQAKIAEMLGAETPLAGSVAEAIAILDRAPKPVKLERYQKLSNAFSALSVKQQDAFFELHADAIERWLKARSA